MAGLYVDTRRFRCRTCGKIDYESLPEVDAIHLIKPHGVIANIQNNTVVAMDILIDRDTSNRPSFNRA